METIIDRINQIKQQLIANSSFVLTTHLSPDGDGLGGILALGLSLRKMGKDVDWFVVDPIPKFHAFLPAIHEIKSRIEDISNFNERQIISIDSSDLERVGGWINHINQESQAIFNIDHHISNTGYGDYQLIDPEAASVCELIYKLIIQLDVDLDEDIATCLLTGLVTDTGCFRFSNTTVSTLEMAANLINLGGRYREIIANVYETKSYQEVILLGKALNTLQIEQNGRLAWLSIDFITVSTLGMGDEQTEMIVNLARNIEGVELAILFKEFEVGTVKVSFRSKESIDAAQLAFQFGGGGHPRASGCSLKSTNLAQAQELILNKARMLFV
jgi:phosphoesterase RecJ-like protein